MQKEVDYIRVRMKWEEMEILYNRRRLAGEGSNNVLMKSAKIQGPFTHSPDTLGPH